MGLHLHARRRRNRAGSLFSIIGLTTLMFAVFAGTAFAGEPGPPEGVQTGPPEGQGPSGVEQPSSITLLPGKGGVNSDGSCESIIGNSDASELVWQFNLTGVNNDGSGANAMLSYSFNPGNSGGPVAPSVFNGGVVKWFVTQPAGAKLVSATVDLTGVNLGQGKSNLVVSHCEGTTPPEGTPPESTQPETPAEVTEQAPTETTAPTTPAPVPTPAPAPVAQQADTLPVTGAGTTLLTLIGLGLLTAGAALTAVKRHRLNPTI